MEKERETVSDHSSTVKDVIIGFNGFGSHSRSSLLLLQKSAHLQDLWCLKDFIEQKAPLPFTIFCFFHSRKNKIHLGLT